VIGRIWHGWTTPQNAEKYEDLLKEEIFSTIAEKKVPGYKGIQLFRRPLDGEEVEFVTIMWFDTWDAVRQFAGEDYERAYVPPAAREVLARFDERSQHYEIKESLEY
jgi:antibiotic biosynthesis monooxygenase (ABM) superfamily enzyme